jgi:hypothetical protein
MPLAPSDHHLRSGTMNGEPTCLTWVTARHLPLSELRLTLAVKPTRTAAASRIQPIIPMLN